MKFYAFSIIIASSFLAIPIKAQNPNINCADKDQAMSNLELTFCAAQDYAASDRELNRVYRKVLSENPNEVNIIRQAQRAWISYRDAECNVVSVQYGNGTGRPMAVTLCKKDLTDERARRLRTYYLGER